MERNYWGIDVIIYTPRTKHSQDEAGLCTHSGNDGDITHLAWKYRCVFETGRNGRLNNLRSEDVIITVVIAIKAIAN